MLADYQNMVPGFDRQISAHEKGDGVERVGLLDPN